MDRLTFIILYTIQAAFAIGFGFGRLITYFLLGGEPTEQNRLNLLTGILIPGVQVAFLAFPVAVAWKSSIPIVPLLAKGWHILLLLMCIGVVAGITYAKQKAKA